MKRTLTAGVLLAALLASRTQAATIYVNGSTGDDTWDGLCEEWDGGTCGPKATIQAGIDAAQGGDTVLVADGTYTGPGNKDLDFNGKDITVRSANGPETCIIDCEGNGRGFYFHSGETRASLLYGFTITHGDADYGGGVHCSNGSNLPPVYVPGAMRVGPSFRSSTGRSCGALREGRSRGLGGSAPKDWQRRANAAGVW